MSLKYSRLIHGYASLDYFWNKLQRNVQQSCTYKYRANYGSFVYSNPDNVHDIYQNDAL